MPVDSGLSPLPFADLRTRQVRILDTIVEHCRRHGLTVYLCAGSLLGAVRHQGFIPWDDDIDIMLPRPDYERLCASFATTGTSKRMSIRSLATDSTYQLPFAKVCDDTTVLDVESDVVSGIGIYVDVFPVDGWLPSGPRRRAQRAALLALQKLFKIKHLSVTPSRSRLKNTVLSAGKALLAALSAREIARAMTWVARRAAFADSADGGVIVWGYREVVPVRSYGTAQQVDFEGRQVPAPADTHDVLERIYGDYMTLPPENKRVTHHRFTAYAR
jgi:lipopolysaccharide cholinephosphotransferase